MERKRERKREKKIEGGSASFSTPLALGGPTHLVPAPVLVTLSLSLSLPSLSCIFFGVTSLGELMLLPLLLRLALISYSSNLPLSPYFLVFFFLPIAVSPKLFLSCSLNPRIPPADQCFGLKTHSIQMGGGAGAEAEGRESERRERARDEGEGRRDHR